MGQVRTFSRRVTVITGQVFMPAKEQYLFVSYAREDRDHILPLVERIRDELRSRALPIELWMDVTSLQPGEQWVNAIHQALQSSIGFLFFASSKSLNSESRLHELSMAAADTSRLIIPVLLHQPLILPTELAHRPSIDLSGHPSAQKIRDAAEKIAKATEKFLMATPHPRAAVSKVEAPRLAAEIAQEFRASAEPSRTETEPTSVFIVIGHDTESLANLEGYLSAEGIASVVLSRRDESPQSLFQKFMAVASQARFAIVLLSGDDYGASRKQYEAANVADRALQFRARQNVILELGFFYGRLGWENVFVLYQKPDRVFPNFERPSDLDGIVFDSISDPQWQKSLGSKLSAAGFKLARRG
jgi:predicted nucleotide-binding protein